MSNGDFEAELQQSVQMHRATIALMVEQAKSRVADSIARVRPVQTPPVLENLPPVDDESFTRAFSQGGPAVRFDDLDDQALPVWEDPS